MAGAFRRVVVARRDGAGPACRFQPPRPRLVGKGLAQGGKRPIPVGRLAGLRTVQEVRRPIEGIDAPLKLSRWIAGISGLFRYEAVLANPGLLDVETDFLGSLVGIRHKVVRAFLDDIQVAALIGKVQQDLSRIPCRLLRGDKSSVD